MDHKEISSVTSYLIKERKNIDKEKEKLFDDYCRARDIIQNFNKLNSDKELIDSFLKNIQNKCEHSWIKRNYDSRSDLFECTFCYKQEIREG